MIKAFAYLRVSGKSQIDGDGFPRQLEACMSYATAGGMEIETVYREKAVQGSTDWEDRAAWVEMMAACVDEGITTIIIEKLDRLARALLVQEHIILDLRKRGITLISTLEPDLGSDDPSRVLMRQIMGAIAEYDRAMIVLKLRGARTRMRKKTGRCEGRKPYGTNPEEVPTLARIEELRRAGETFGSIADKLNEEGRVTRYGKAWRQETLAKMLRKTAAAA